VKSRWPLAELRKVFRRLPFVAKICEIRCTGILRRRRVAHYASEDAAHPLHLFAEARKQIGPIAKTKTSRQRLQRFAIFGDGVSLLFGLDLEPVFDPGAKSDKPSRAGLRPR